MEVSHTFKLYDAKNDDDEKKFQEFSNSAIVVVGETGTGKSSLINLFCGNDVKIAHGIASGTQDSRLFSDKADKNRFWLDSQGSNDSKGVEDEKVLTDVLKTLYNEQIGNVKVLWCIEGGKFPRAKDTFRTQAAFIKSLGGAVWSSTLIIQKGARPKPKGIDGLLAAAKDEGSDIGYGDNRLFGFTGLQYGNGKHLEDDELYQDWVEDFGDNSTKLNAKLSKFGYYTNQQIMQYINARLSALSTLKLKFTISECTKCGVKGDQRFIYASCHVAKEQHHPQEIEMHHPGVRQSRQIHTGSVETRKYHPEEVTSSTSWYHPCSRTSTNYHPSGTIRYKYFLFSSWSWGEKHKCCDKVEGSSGCETRYYHPCCNSDHSGCATRTDYYYRCCKRSPSSEGCDIQPYYTCCNTYNSGCQTEWYYTCCDKDDGGCKPRYKCCAKGPNSDGCEERCSNAICYKKWGTGPGCTQTSKTKKKST